MKTQQSNWISSLEAPKQFNPQLSYSEFCDLLIEKKLVMVKHGDRYVLEEDKVQWVGEFALGGNIYEEVFVIEENTLRELIDEHNGKWNEIWKVEGLEAEYNELKRIYEEQLELLDNLRNSIQNLHNLNLVRLRHLGLNI